MFSLVKRLKGLSELFTAVWGIVTKVAESKLLLVILDDKTRGSGP